MADKYVEHLLAQRISPKFKADDWLRPRHILKKDDTLVVDFSEFDAMIEAYLVKGLNTLKLGIRDWEGSWRSWYTAGASWDEAITKAQFSLQVYDESSGKNRVLTVPLRSSQYDELMGQLLPAWYQHLKAKGWLDIAYAYPMDEPPRELYPLIAEMDSLLDTAAPGLPFLVPIPGWTFKPETADLQGVDIWTITLDALDRVGRDFVTSRLRPGGRGVVLRLQRTAGSVCQLPSERAGYRPSDTFLDDLEV